MTYAQAEEFFHRLAVANPAPESTLDFYSPYTLLVAVVLSAQTTDSRVNKVTKSLFTNADTPKKMLLLGEKRLLTYISTVGLFHNKARHIISLSRLLIDNHNGLVPSDRESLEKLPGVGRKSANVVLNIAFKQPMFAVDTHVFRVCNRSGLAPGNTPFKVEQKLEYIVPVLYCQYAHLWLVLHGRHICKARKPLCTVCITRDLCLWKHRPCSIACSVQKE